MEHFSIHVSYYSHNTNQCVLSLEVFRGKSLKILKYDTRY